MAVELIVRREFSRLVPVTQRDIELLEELPLRKDLTARLSGFRSGRHHRFYWALISKVAKNTEKFRNAEHLHMALKVAMGFYEDVEVMHGQIVMQVKSTAWAKMDQHEFKQFFDGALLIIVEEVVPGMSRTELLDEVAGMLGYTYDDLWKVES